MRPWEETERPAAERARALVEAIDGRTALKRWGAWLDREPVVRAALLHLARERDVDLPDEAVDWPGKKLLRRAQAREAQSRVRTNPIRRDEAFTCAFCHRDVPAHGRTARDHCPFCLRSLHVDVVPGDRAADCGGVLHPVSLDRRGSAWVIHYRCERCGYEHPNRATTDGDVPDDPRALRALTG